MIAAVALSPVLVVVLLVILVLAATGPRAYGYYRPAYVGPHTDWVWILVAVLVLLWLFGYI